MSDNVRPTRLEYKSVVSTSPTPGWIATGLRPCSICGIGTVKVPSGISRRGSAVICADCVREAADAINVPAQAVYADAIQNETEHDRLPDGSLSRRKPGRRL